MVSYKEITKPLDDVLEKQFVHNKPWSVDLKHKLNNPSIKLSGHVNPDGKLTCASSSGLGLGPIGINGLFGLDGSGGLQLSYNNDLVQGLTLQANVTSTKKTVREQKIELQAKYQKEPWRAHLTLNPVDRRWGVALLGKRSILDKNHVIMGGLDISGDKLAPPTISGAGLGYTFNVKGHTINTSLTLAPQDDLSIGRVSLGFASQAGASSSKIAARYTYLVSKDVNELSVGAGWYLDPKTEQTAIRARIDQDARVAVSLTHKVNDAFSATIGMGFDTEKSSDGYKISLDNGPKFGIKLNLSA